MRQRLILFLAAAFFAVGTMAAVSGGPTAQLRTSLEAVITTLKDGDMTAAVRRQRIADLIHQRFDFRTMSQRALSTNWKKASTAQRQQFVDKFSQLILATYMGRIEAYTDESIEYVAKRVKGNKAEVTTVIVSGNTEIPIRYKLRRKGGDWLVYDVVIEEVSLIRNYRSSYRDIVKKEGIAGLLARMDEKLAMLERR
ncbi:MAG: phospholipid-binding protein MlaC [Gammaproteobacteria bacterium]